MNNMTSGGSIVKRGHYMYSTTNMNNASSHKSLGKITKRRFRSAFTTEQINYLEQQFKKCPYIINRKEISEVLQIPERAIKIWFQNRRMKEKKESSNKEFGNESNHNILAKDQLVNVPSVNEPQYSLSLLSDGRPINGEGIIRNDSISLIIEKKYNENESKSELQHPIDSCNIPQLKQNKDNASEDSSSEKFSIDLYRKYKKSLMKSSNTNLIHVNSQHDDSKLQSNIQLSCSSKQNETTQNIIPDSTKPAATEAKYDYFKKDEVSYTPYNLTHYNQKPVEYAPMKYEYNEQLMPEDLSKKYRNIDDAKKEKLTNSSIQDTGFISVVPSFYAQSYMQANGVIWKPVSLMPVVPTASSPSSFLPKKACNCDCHLSRESYQQSQGPQYVFTMPFQNPSADKNSF